MAQESPEKDPSPQWFGASWTRAEWLLAAVALGLAVLVILAGLYAIGDGQQTSRAEDGPLFDGTPVLASTLWPLFTIVALTASTLTAYTVGTVRGAATGWRLLAGLATLSIVVPYVLAAVWARLPPWVYELIRS
jgi:hypothetical protein